jgi:hypothetical protein
MTEAGAGVEQLQHATDQLGDILLLAGSTLQQGIN